MAKAKCAPNDPCKLTVKQLQARLRASGKRTSGRKAELIKRLYMAPETKKKRRRKKTQQKSDSRYNRTTQFEGQHPAERYRRYYGPTQGAYSGYFLPLQTADPMSGSVGPKQVTGMKLAASQKTPVVKQEKFHVASPITNPADAVKQTNSFFDSVRHGLSFVTGFDWQRA